MTNIYLGKNLRAYIPFWIVVLFYLKHAWNHK